MEKLATNGKYKRTENLESLLYLHLHLSKLLFGMDNGMISQTEALTEYLQQLQRQGETHVHLDETSTLILREFYKRAKKLQKRLSPTSPEAVKETPTSTTPSVASTSNSNEFNKPPVSENIPPQSISAPAPAPSPQETQPIPNKAPNPESLPKLKLKPFNQANSPEIQLQELEQQTRQLGESGFIPSLRQKAVFSSGNPHAKVVFIGDAPGYNDEKSGSPFNGPAGQKLDAILKAMDLKREEVYLTYLVKLRPSQAQQTTNTRKPTLQEAQTFLPIFEQEMQIIQPSVIIALGSETSPTLIHKESDLASLRTETHVFNGIPFLVTYPLLHLLHNEATEEKRFLWEDMLKAMEILQLPISDKQRGYFLKRN